MKNWKVFLFALMFIGICSLSFAADTSTTTTSDGLAGGFLAAGQDNLWLAEKGQRAFVAVGAGVDLLKYQKSFSYGGVFVAKLHATAAARVTGNDVGYALAGASVNIDLIKLIAGLPGLEFLGTFTCEIGPVAVYDTLYGKPAYGGLINFTYKF